MTDAHHKKGAGEKKTALGGSFPKNRGRLPKEGVTPLGYHFIPEMRHFGRLATMSDILPTILAKSGMTRRLAVEKYRQCWKDAVEQVLAPRGLVLDEGDVIIAGFRGGVLSMTVSSAPLEMELSFCQREILRFFQTRLPDEKIKKIRFVQR